MSLPPPRPAPLPIEIPPDLQSHYANIARIAHAPAEFVIEFARILPGETKAVVGARVIMSPVGAKLLLQALTDNLETQTAAPHAKPHALPEPLRRDCLDDADILDAATAAEVVSGWRVEEKPWVGRFGRVLVADQPGAELRSPFDGTSIGLYYVLGPDSGNFEWRLDDGQWQETCPFDVWAKEWPRPHYRILADGLPPGRHVLGLRISANKHADSKGTCLRLGYFMVSRW